MQSPPTILYFQCATHTKRRRCYTEAAFKDSTLPTVLFQAGSGLEQQPVAREVLWYSNKNQQILEAEVSESVREGGKKRKGYYMIVILNIP